MQNKIIDGVIYDFCEDDEIIIVSKDIKKILKDSFLGLSCRIIRFEGDCEIEDGAFIGLENLEVLDIRAFENTSNFDNLSKLFIDCPKDICIIVKDNKTREFIEENDTQNELVTYPIFTSFEYFEPDRRCACKEYGLISLFDFKPNPKKDYSKLVDYRESWTTEEDKEAIKKVRGKGIKAIYIPDYFDGCEIILDTDKFLQMVELHYPSVKYLRLPKIEAKSSISAFGLKPFSFSKIHLSRKGDSIPFEFFRGSENLKTLYIPSNIKNLHGFQNSLLEDIVFENVDTLERVDYSFGFATPYMLDRVRECANNGYEIFCWKNIAMYPLSAFAKEETIVIPDDIKIISDGFLGKYSRANNIKFRTKAVAMGKNTKYIGISAFEKTNIDEIYFRDSKILKIFDRAFFEARIKEVCLPDSTKYIGSEAFALTVDDYDDNDAFAINRKIVYPKSAMVEPDAFMVDFVEPLPFN